MNQELEPQPRKVVYQCPDCGNTDVERKNGEVYCIKCGLVIE